MMINLENAPLWAPIALGDGSFVVLNVYHGEIKYDPDMPVNPAGLKARAEAKVAAKEAHEALRADHEDEQEYTMIYTDEDADGTNLELRQYPDGNSIRWAFISGFSYVPNVEEVKEEEHHE